jgi:electron-transferring-flavoprotein dehydrogenase
MKSGMLAAEAVFDAISQDIAEASSYQQKLQDSWLWNELYKVRNIRPSFSKGFVAGMIYSAFDTYIFRGKAPWTFKHHVDHLQLNEAKSSKKIEYPKPDNSVSFDRNSSVYLSSTNHEENQPVHLQLIDNKVPIEVNLKKYDSPEQRYCPAGVYEIVQAEDNSDPYLQINAQNCVHCKTCDIKDPTQNIKWVTPEGGGGPNYPNM